MVSGDLFRAFTVRFSFKKEQHVRLLKKFEDEKLTGGKDKNQIVMDALEMYFDALENNNDTKEDKWNTKEFVQQQLEQYRQECKEEILGEILRILISGRMAGQPFMVFSPVGKQETEEVMENGLADISVMPDVMDKIMDWSSSYNGGMAC